MTRKGFIRSPRAGYRPVHTGTFEKQAINLISKSTVGILIWLGLIVVAVIGLRAANRESPAAAEQLIQHLSTPRRRIQVVFPLRQVVAVNDPIYASDTIDSNGDKTGSARPIGRVSRLGPLEERIIPAGLIGGGEPLSHQKIAYVSEATIELFGSADRLRTDARIVAHAAPHSTEWVLQTMLTPEKRRKIVTLIVNSWQRHMPEIADALKPVVKDSLTLAGSVIQEDLKAAFAKREKQFQAIGERYETELLRKKIIPIVEEEIWPLVEERGRPLAEKIGTEIWQELSLWRFSWRYLYDKSPLPKRDFTQREFDRFVKEKAAPIMKAHVPDILEVQKHLVDDFANNETIRRSLRESYRTIVGDQEVQRLLAEIFREVLIDNQRLQQQMKAAWQTGQARRAVELASRRLDPTINRIGEALFGNPNTEITPEFARVMRRMVLRKDQRWFVLDAGNAESSLRDSNEPLVADRGASETIPYSKTTEKDN